MSDALNKKPIRTVSSRPAWQSQWYGVREDTVRLPDASTGTYYVLEMRPSVWIVPLTPSGEVVLIETYRHTLGAWCVELPAGGIEDAQDPLDAAREELRQEVGGVADEFHLLLHAATMNGIGNHRGYFYLATGVTLTEPQHERMEFIRVQTLPVDDALSLARNGGIDDALSVMALLLAAPQIHTIIADNTDRNTR